MLDYTRSSLLLTNFSPHLFIEMCKFIKFITVEERAPLPRKNIRVPWTGMDSLFKLARAPFTVLGGPRPDGTKNGRPSFDPSKSCFQTGHLLLL